MAALPGRRGNDTALKALHERLSSLDRNCLTGLQGALESARAGDLSVVVTPVTTALTETSSDPVVQGLINTFNSMLGRAQGAIDAFNEMRAELQSALGDHSCLADLTDRLVSLDQNCLTNLRAGLAAVAKGDLTDSVVPVTTGLDAKPGQNLGSLGELFNGMLAKAQDSIEGYEAMRNNTISLVRDLADTAENLGNASGQMATVAEEAGRAVAEIAGTIESVADGSSHQAQSATAVNQAVEDATNVIDHLGQKSQEIGAIVSTISGIASQTNLLALNAAIEAARAGDQGRGFAVVADEVRKLAEDSQQSASSIASLIGQVQNETARAVEAMSTVQQDVAAVAAVSEENAAAAEEVSASTEQTSAATQEVAAHAEQVAKTAQVLGNLVTRFTID